MIEIEILNDLNIFFKTIIFFINENINELFPHKNLI